jgi:hypothetical protein
MPASAEGTTSVTGASGSPAFAVSIARTSATNAGSPYATRTAPAISPTPATSPMSPVSPVLPARAPSTIASDPTHEV